MLMPAPCSALHPAPAPWAGPRCRRRRVPRGGRGGGRGGGRPALHRRVAGLGPALPPAVLPRPRRVHACGAGIAPTSSAHVRRPHCSGLALRLQARCWARRRPRLPRAPPTPRAPPPTPLSTSGAAASMGAGMQGGAAAGAAVPRCRWRRTRAQRRLADCPTPPHTHPPRRTLTPSDPPLQLLRPHRRHRRGPPAERGGAERGGARVGRRGRRR